MESERCCGKARRFAVVARAGFQGRCLSVSWVSVVGGLSGSPPRSAAESKVLAGFPGLHRSRPRPCHPYLLIEPLAPGAKSHLMCVIKSRVARKSRALLIRERHSCVVVVFRSWHHCHSKLPVRLNIELVVLRASIIPPTSSPHHHLLSCTSNLIFCQVVAFK